jgi:hypothetical protein
MAGKPALLPFAQSKSRVITMSDGTATFTSCTFSGNSDVRTRNLCSVPCSSIGSLASLRGIGWWMRRGVGGDGGFSVDGEGRCACGIGMVREVRAAGLCAGLEASKPRGL